MAGTAKNRARLGRGLSSLISVSELADTPEPGMEATISPTPPPLPRPTEIPVGSIRRNPNQPRREMNQATLAELAASIRSTGVIQPVVVRADGDGFELIAGERRWRAAQLAGLSHLPAIVREVDRYTQAQMALIENIQREDLNAIDRALAYKALMEQLGLTQAELSTRLGEDRSSIANYLRLIDLSEEVRTLVGRGELSLGHAKLLAGVDDPAEQERLGRLVVQQGLSVRNLERLIQHGSAAPATTPPQTPSAHLLELEQNLSRQLGARVQIRAARKKGKGKLILHYATLDEFDQLCQRLGVQLEST